MTEYETRLRDEFAKIAFDNALKDVDLRKRAYQIADVNGTQALSVIAEYVWGMVDELMTARTIDQEPKP